MEFGMVVVAFSRLPVLAIEDVNGISDARKIKVSIKSLLWILTNIDDSQIELHSHTNAPKICTSLLLDTPSFKLGAWYCGFI